MSWRYKGPFLGIVERDGWEYCKRTNSTGVVAIVARTVANEVVLVTQYRIPVAAHVIEFPAGLVGDDDDSETLLTAAKRELEEETGFRSDHWRPLGNGASSAGLSSETVEFFLADRAYRVSEGGGTGDEDITVHVIRMPDLNAWVEERKSVDGMIPDAKLYSPLWLVDRIAQDSAAD